MTFFFLPRLSISTVVHALVSFPRSPRDGWTTTPRNATISRFSSRPPSAKPNQLARVCTSLTDAFSSAVDTCPFHVLPLDPFALLPPSLPPWPITRHREKRRAVITPVFFWLIRSFRLEIPSARNALVIRNRTYKYPRFLPAIIFYLRGARL